MTNNLKLLPCPFCSGEAVESTGLKGDNTPRSIFLPAVPMWPYIECIDCGATSEPEMWNHRITTVLDKGVKPGVKR